MSIRLKVTLPYLLLTLVVAVIGVYVVTHLVSSTLSERLTNQLLEAGRVVSDSFVRQEVSHVSSARIIAYTDGVAAALQNEDHETVLNLVKPVVSGLSVENVILISPQGKELVHLIKDKDGVLQSVDQNTGAAQSPIVTPFLHDRNVEEAPHRALGINLVNNKYYYYTALPVPLGDQFSGVVVVGTSIDTILPLLKSTSLADVILYGGNGAVIGTTLGGGSLDENSLQKISITDTQFNQIINQDNVVAGENLILSLESRNYRLARGPLQIGNDRIGVFAVVLPENFVMQSAQGNRTTYVILFTAVFLVVIGIGYAVTRLIIVPLYSLVRTSQAIASGHLEQRTGIHTGDEIGTLAFNFDEMTTRLQERTAQLEERTIELQKSNEALAKMDKTKSNFIQISAHELRTPLTLIMGYSQMLEDMVRDNSEAATLARGILDGSDRMSAIVSSMLDVSRIDSNSLFLKKTALQLDLVIKKVQKDFAEAFAERHIEFKTVGLGELPFIPADPELIQKVFYHLIMNAIKYTPDGGCVTISGQHLNGSEPPQVKIAVQDTGIGIDPEAHDLIFNKFYQTGDVLLHSSGKTKFKGGGPGLGLAIARGIVEAHGGKIWVESPGHDEETNPGSTFYVTLPVGKKQE